MSVACGRSVAVLSLVVTACAVAGVKERELPSEPIAFLYYSAELARRRAEVLEEREEQRRGRRPDDRDKYQNRGVVNLTSIGDYLDDTFGPGLPPEYEGRLALLDSRTAEVEVVDSALRGAIPLAWTPDHRRLLFTQDVAMGMRFAPGQRAREMQLFELDRETGVVLRLTRGPDQHPWGCYGPGGRLVALIAREELPEAEPGQRRRPRPRMVTRVAVAEPGGRLQPLTEGPEDRDPACAPDGSSVAWVVPAGRGREEIRVLSPVEGGTPRTIAPGSSPSYSPDGQWIVYTHTAAGKSVIWRIRPDGSGRTRMGLGSGAEELRPSVSPDGTLVVYESEEANRFRLFLRRFDGTGDRVLFAAGDGQRPVW